MSFSGGRTPLYTSSLALLLIMHICISGHTTCTAIRLFPQRTLTAAEEDHRIAEAAPAPAKSQTEIFREYFKSRLSDLHNTTNGTTYADFKRKIPSCPDPLHN